MPSRRSLSPTSGISTASLSVPRIVTKLALEGRSRNNGASVKLYLKLSIPLETVIHGSPIPLFPEESLKIVDSIVHPIDERNVPYAFSNSSLMQASRALNLPTRSSKSYLSLFPHMSPNATLNERLTGHISVVEFQVTYVLPKEFPQISGSQDRHFTPNSRSNSMLNFMAALEVVLPFRSVPPLSPFTLSIPIPRCLQNSIKFQISRPPNGDWDVLVTPPVTPRPPSSPKSVSSSMSSLVSNPSDDLFVVGSFPSANEFVLRFALRDENEPPSTPFNPKRASLRAVSVQTEWLILDRQPDSIRARLAASFKLKNIWYAGVATQVGLDVSLQTSEGEVEWGDEDNPGWQITGSLGYSGVFNIFEKQATSGLDRIDVARLGNSVDSPRSDSPLPLGSISSLLRAPLPQSNELDFSFESNSQDTSPLGTPTSSIVTTSAPASRYPSHDPGENTRAGLPCSPLVLKLDMSDLRLSANSDLDCQIRGTLTIRTDLERRIALPSFVFPNASDHRGELLIRSDVTGLALHSERAISPIPLLKGVSHRCPENTVLSVPKEHLIPATNTVDRPLVVLATPKATLAPNSPMASKEMNGQSVDFIPEVFVKIIPLLPSQGFRGIRCAIHLQMTYPRSGAFPCSKLEFGLASGSGIQEPDIQLISSTVGNYTVDATFVFNSDAAELHERALDSGQPSEWVCWVRVPFHQQGSPESLIKPGDIRLTYITACTSGDIAPKWQFWRTSTQIATPLLPCFSAKIGRLVVETDDALGWTNEIDATNLAIRSNSHTAASYALQPFFFPVLSLKLKPGSKYLTCNRWLERLFLLLLGALLFAIFSRPLQTDGLSGMIAHRSPRSILVSEFSSSSSLLSPIEPDPTHPPSLQYTEIGQLIRHGYRVIDQGIQESPQLSPEGISGRVLPEYDSSSSHRAQSIDDQKSVSGDFTGSDLPLRARAFAAFTVMRLQKFYNVEVTDALGMVRDGMSKGWHLCTTIWNWPLPP